MDNKNYMGQCAELFSVDRATFPCACNANTRMLLGRLCFSYVYIPLLPAGLVEVLNTPTPFIAGVHSSLKPEISDLVSTNAAQ